MLYNRKVDEEEMKNELALKIEMHNKPGEVMKALPDEPRRRTIDIPNLDDNDYINYIVKRLSTAEGNIEHITEGRRFL